LIILIWWFGVFLYLLLDILLELIKRMAVKKKSEKRQKKEDYWFRLQDVVGKYKNVLFINSDNVSSNQILKIRARLRTIDAYMIMGKNTLMKAALTAANKEP